MWKKRKNLNYIRVYSFNPYHSATSHASISLIIKNLLALQSWICLHVKITFVFYFSRIMHQIEESYVGGLTEENKKYQIIAIDASPVRRKLQQPSDYLLVLLVLFHPVSHFLLRIFPSLPLNENEPNQETNPLMPFRSSKKQQKKKKKKKKIINLTKQEHLHPRTIQEFLNGSPGSISHIVVEETLHDIQATKMIPRSTSNEGCRDGETESWKIRMRLWQKKKKSKSCIYLPRDLWVSFSLS